MNARVNGINRYDWLLLSLFLFCFRQGIVSLLTTFTSAEFYENGIAFLLVTALFIVTVIQDTHSVRRFPAQSTIPFLSLLIITALYTANALVFKFSIVPAVIFLLALYCLLGFYLNYTVWKRSLFIFFILILTLPLLERVQKFFGFPIRLITADIVSALLRFFGIGTVSSSAVIVSENHATSIDLPCSGVKSIYTGGLFMFAVYYLRRASLSLKLAAITAMFFASLLFFNIWRVFSLVYIYDVLDMKSFGDTIHVFLGVSGFLISCGLLWWVMDRWMPKQEEQKDPEHILDRPVVRRKQLVSIVFCIVILIHWFAGEPQSLSDVRISAVEHSFVLEHIPLSGIPFTDREQSYFLNSDVEYGRKFSGVTAGGKTFSLLIVASKSARTHHDPEICLQGLGHRITGSNILQTDTTRLRRLGLNDTRDQAVYWYVGKEKNLLDYSERVWEEVTNPQQSWALVIIGFTEEVDITRPDISDLIRQVNTQSKTLLD